MLCVDVSSGYLLSVKGRRKVNRHCLDNNNTLLGTILLEHNSSPKDGHPMVRQEQDVLRSARISTLQDIIKDQARANIPQQLITR
ncbi:hypothetical protein J6590_000038 [Homalodisca vitripennis]|nr:hypothetical protein J6590_000038 [Homalodisca vitripennis]